MIFSRTVRVSSTTKPVWITMRLTAGGRGVCSIGGRAATAESCIESPVCGWFIVIELTICGRGSQGEVTLAKLIAAAYIHSGKHAQAFSAYAAEHSGTLLQASVRIDDNEITNHEPVQNADYVVVLDCTLVDSRVLTGVKQDGLIILNAQGPSEAFAEVFPGRRVAVVDATAIATDSGHGAERADTTMLGAVANVLGLSKKDIGAALADYTFDDTDVSAAHLAYETVKEKQLEGRPATAPVAVDAGQAVVMPHRKDDETVTHRPQRRQLTPPCGEGCAAGVRVRDFVAAVRKKDCDRAVEIILEASPFPAVCGRICPAPCMASCNRNRHDESINIRELERYAAQHGRRPSPTMPWRDERVAVVGSGPAGLSASYHTARLGYPVTLHEKDKELGGALRTGTPSYRLPRDVLDAEIDYIIEHGVTVKTGTRVDRAGLLKLSRAYAAVFVGTGLQDARSVDLGPEGERIVTQGNDFLDRVRRDEVTLANMDVIVVGGGNTAIEAARSARRVGARSIRVVYRRTRDDMPAIREEVEQGFEEGILLDELVSPVRIRHGGAGAVLTCSRMRLSEPDESGQRRPDPEITEDAYFDLHCHRVILALDRTVDLSLLPEGGEVREGEKLLGLTGAPVFSGGVFAGSEEMAAAAIGSGRKAAWHIHKTLAGENLFPTSTEPAASPETIKMHVFAHHLRKRGRMVTAKVRRRNFTEVQRGFDGEDSAAAALVEAGRCLSCGACNTCGCCESACPEGVLVRDGEGYRFDYDHCTGCGTCMAQCPRSLIYLVEL